jgi:hypothetical protein
MSPLDPDFDPRRRTVVTYGRYTVQLDPLVHLPYGLYRVYCAGKYVGAQLSFPSESDCQWLHRWKGVYATADQNAAHKPYGYTTMARIRRRGRPTKAQSDQELQEALAA